MEEALEEVGPEAAGNERLALLGDKVLDLMLLNRWYGEDTTTGRPTPVTADNVLIARRSRDSSASGLRLQ
jgi:hypothetical protein